MIYCSAGLNSIIIKTNRYICPCYSIHNPIGNIDDFNIDILKSTKCDQKKCLECDKNFTERSINKKLIQEKQLVIIITVTNRCFHFCPYCTHSDYSEEINAPLYPIPINDYINFLSKIKRNSLILLMGGEPTLRKDLHELFISNNNTFILFTAALYYDNAIKIFDTVEKNNTKLVYKPTLHHTSKDFDWDIFWSIIEKANKISNIEIPEITLVNYKINDIVKDVEKKCKELKVKLLIKSLDTSVVSSRIELDKNYKTLFKKLNENKKITFKKI